MSRPPARHQKPSQQSPARLDQYDGPYNEAPYSGNPYDGRNDDSLYAEARYYDGGYDEPQYDRPYAPEPQYERPYAEPQYDDRWYGEPQYGDGPYAEARYRDGQHGEPQHNDGPYDEGAYDGARYDRGVPDHPTPPRDRGAHRHARPPRKRRKPVKIAAAMAGSTLLVAGAVPVAAHYWWHRPTTHPTALDQENPASTPGAALGAGAQTSSRPAAPENTLDQWAQIPIGKHAAAQVGAANRTAKRAAAPRPHAPRPHAPRPHAPRPHAPRPKPKATPSAAYRNPLRDVSGLVLERVDMGVDFGGAGPVFALGDGVITNATGDSTGWPGGGYITYQLTDGPDAGLVVYLAEDVKPAVQVGQKVTSSTVIANMFNGGDGIETGWATSDSSTAESQTAAAGGISGNGPFPTMVGLSFEAVLESVGVPAAPNANEPGNGLLPAGYPPT